MKLAPRAAEGARHTGPGSACYRRRSVGAGAPGMQAGGRAQHQLQGTRGL